MNTACTEPPLELSLCAEHASSTVQSWYHLLPMRWAWVLFFRYGNRSWGRWIAFPKWHNWWGESLGSPGCQGRSNSKAIPSAILSFIPEPYKGSARQREVNGHWPKPTLPAGLTKVEDYEPRSERQLSPMQKSLRIKWNFSPVVWNGHHKSAWWQRNAMHDLLCPGSLCLWHAWEALPSLLVPCRFIIRQPFEASTGPAQTDPLKVSTPVARVWGSWWSGSRMLHL